MLFTTIPAKSVVKAHISTSASGRLHSGNSSSVVALLPSPFTKCPTWSVPIGHTSMPIGPVPAGPAGPARPVLPLFPGGPCVPVSPGGPGGPCGPAGPGGPCVPVILLSFLSLSFLSSNLMCLQNSTELTKNPSKGPVLHSYFLSSVGYWL